MTSQKGCIIPKCASTGKLLTGGEKRIKSLISSSISRQDDLHVTLKKQHDDNPDLQVQFHKSCIFTYTSKTHIERERKRKLQEGSPSISPKKRRSDVPLFDFRKHCLLCGNECLPKDYRHPKHWRRVVQCRTKEMRNELLKVCDERDDSLARSVRLRIYGSISDLHAADAQYHYDCLTKFKGSRNITAAKRLTQINAERNTDPDIALISVIHELNKDLSRIWNSLEIYDLYCQNSGTGENIDSETPAHQSLSRRERANLIHKLEEHFGENLVVLHVKGCASLICFKDHLPETLKLVPTNEDDSITEISLAIHRETKAKSSKESSYHLQNFTRENIIARCSSTLLTLISNLVSKGKHTKKSLSLTQAIQSHVSKTYNQTTLGLAVQVHHRTGSRELVDILHEHGFTCSYDEVKTFRKSAAVQATEEEFRCQSLLQGSGPISAWFDNFDLNIFTPNGMKETHSLAVEFVQYGDESSSQSAIPAIDIPRIPKHRLQSYCLSEKTSVKPQIHSTQSKGNRPIPPVTDSHVGTPFHLLLERNSNLRSALEKDVSWIVSVVDSDESDGEVPDWSGSMVAQSRASGALTKPPTSFVFGPLIDLPPAHPDTILSALVFTEESLQEQEHILLSVDMQLYQVVMQIKWSDPSRWSKLVVRPGGMHTLMSFIGCIGKLMNGSGLENLLSAAFKGIENMLNGKAWPKALRGLRMVVCALLHPLVSAGNHTFESLEDQLVTASQNSRTARLWIDCLITPVMLAHLFIRAEREGDWLLHMYALKQMVPYFFAAGHWNYARYILWHTIEMETSLPVAVLSRFLKGEHVCHHRSGHWNGVFLDQYGEQTYIRYGKCKGGLVGKSLTSEQVAEWVLSHHVCSSLAITVNDMYEEETVGNEEQRDCYHKEEGKRRRELDKTDRQKILNELRKYSNPLLTQSSDPLHNVVNGRIAGNEVNVDRAVEIGTQMAADFKSKLPSDFNKPLKKIVVTMQSIKARVKVGEEFSFDIEKLFARLLVVSQKREVKLADLFKYELSPVPSSLFDEYGDMRKSQKASLMSKLQVAAEDLELPVDLQIVDGNAGLYHVSWPKVTLSNFHNVICRTFVAEHDVVIVFDKYNDVSIKSHERKRRNQGATCPSYTFTPDTALPPRDNIMKSESNKKALIHYLCSSHHDIPNLQLQGENSLYNHEEADVTILSNFLYFMNKRNHIQILADDTDIFVLLLYFYWLYKPQTQVTMKKFSGQIVDINATARELGDCCLDLLPAHCLSGCDTVSFPFGKGKVTAFNTLQKHNISLRAFSNKDSHEKEWTEEGRKYLAALYGSPESSSFNYLRHTIFAKKKEAPKIKNLPPTDIVALQHIKRARLQALLWTAADQDTAPALDISQYGWRIENHVPVPEMGNESIAPPELLQTVACSCRSLSPCSGNRCSCHSQGLSCTSYCKCEGDDKCCSTFTKHSKDTEHSTDDIEEDDDEEDINNE